MLTGRMQGQRIRGNQIGVSGAGVLGGDDLEHPNEIDGNDIGVQFDGVVQYNRIANNRVGIAAQPNQWIVHNLIYRNVAAGRAGRQRRTGANRRQHVLRPEG
jgi:hypothetical protein